MTTRRTLLGGAAGTLVTTWAARAQAGAGTPPADVGRKFAPDGQVLPFLGNTIICHLPQQGEGSQAFDALLDIYRALPTQGWSRKMTATPPSSYHMTVIGGADDRDRRYPLWPGDLPLDLPIADCNRILGERLRNVRLGEVAPPYRMRVDLQAPADARPLTIRLTSADAATEQRLRRLRDRLSDALRIQDTNHAGYRFHITLGYLFAALTPGEDADYRRALAGWKAMMAARAPVITLGAPEYCLLTDMFAFKRQFFLA